MPDNMFSDADNKPPKTKGSELLGAGKNPPEEKSIEELADSTFSELKIEKPKKIIKQMVHLSLEEDLIKCIEEDKKIYGTNSFVPEKVLRHYYEQTGRIKKKGRD